MISCPALVFFFALGRGRGWRGSGVEREEEREKRGAEGARDKECGCLARADVCCLEWTFLCVPPGEASVHWDYILCPYILYV